MIYRGFDAILTRNHRKWLKIVVFDVQRSKNEEYSPWKSLIFVKTCLFQTPQNRVAHFLSHDSRGPLFPDHPKMTLFCIEKWSKYPILCHFWCQNWQNRSKPFPWHYGSWPKRSKLAKMTDFETFLDPAGSLARAQRFPENGCPGPRKWVSRTTEMGVQDHGCLGQGQITGQNHHFRLF